MVTIPQNTGTDIEAVLFRSRFIFLGLFVLFLTVFSGALFAGMQSGEITKKIASAQKNWRDFQKALEPLPTPTPIFIKEYPTPTDEPTPTPIQQRYYQPSSPTSTPVPQQPQRSYTFPSYPTPIPFQFPTAVPGQPGSKEWEADFQKKWDEMTKQNAAMQKQVEDAQKAFCDKNPSLCNK